jgi:hypothetical protein
MKNTQAVLTEKIIKNFEPKLYNELQIAFPFFHIVRVIADYSYTDRILISITIEGGFQMLPSRIYLQTGDISTANISCNSLELKPLADRIDLLVRNHFFEE